MSDWPNPRPTKPAPPRWFSALYIATMPIAWVLLLICAPFSGLNAAAKAFVLGILRLGREAVDATRSDFRGHWENLWKSR